MIETILTKQQLENIISTQKKLFDIVRIVIPDGTQVAEITDDGISIADKTPCFAVWNKNERCENCISLKACTEGRRMTKFEFRNNEIYTVISYPFILALENEHIAVAMEMVNHVTNDLQLHTHGSGRYSTEVKVINKALYVDSLTGAYNRRYFDEHMYVYNMMSRLPKKIGFMLADVRKFKSINDMYGHAEGDEVLKSISETLKKNVRSADSVIRFGGDEFIVVLRDCSEEFLDDKAQQIKEKVKAIRIDSIPSLEIEINIGCSYSADFDGTQEQLMSLFNEADAKMYSDKHKNQI